MMIIIIIIIIIMMMMMMMILDLVLSIVDSVRFYYNQPLSSTIKGDESGEFMELILDEYCME
jgi:hypothetical protein